MYEKDLVSLHPQESTDTFIAVEAGSFGSLIFKTNLEVNGASVMETGSKKFEL